MPEEIDVASEVIIDPRNDIRRINYAARSFRDACDEIAKWELKPGQIYMTQQDYMDIVEFSKQ